MHVHGVVPCFPPSGSPLGGKPPPLSTLLNKWRIGALRRATCTCTGAVSVGVGTVVCVLSIDIGAYMYNVMSQTLYM